jgi:hypothetical protein
VTRITASSHCDSAFSQLVESFYERQKVFGKRREVLVQLLHNDDWNCLRRENCRYRHCTKTIGNICGRRRSVGIVIVPRQLKLLVEYIDIPSVERLNWYCLLYYYKKLFWLTNPYNLTYEALCWHVTNISTIAAWSMCASVDTLCDGGLLSRSDLYTERAVINTHVFTCSRCCLFLLNDGIIRRNL